MRKVFALLALLLSFNLSAQEADSLRPQQDEFPIKEYQELPNPLPKNLNEWKAVKAINLSWASTDVRYRKESTPKIKEEKKLKLKAWRGEKVSAQFLVWGTKELKSLNVQVKPIRKGRRTISAECIRTSFVRYVMTDELNKDGKGACGCRPDANAFASSLVADPLDHLTQSIKLDKNTTRAVWLSLAVPQETKAGNYKTTLIVRDGRRTIGRLKLELEVLERVLPKPEDWAFHLDLWQNPYAIARYHKVNLWSKEHFEAMKPYMEMYKNAGGKVITTSIINRPWNGQTYDAFQSMVTWVRKADGSWSFDFTIFDMWVEFMMSIGIKKEINCYSMVPWKLEFQYFDQATNSLKVLNTKPGEALYSEVWGQMLKAFAEHLKEKSWFDITYISMDERPKSVMQKTLKLIKEVEPEFKISLAGALHPELSDNLDDYCVALRMKISKEMKEKRRKEGKVTSFYTSCEEPYPNTFTFSTPAESEWLGWYAAKENLDGYLRWAYNSWPKQPLLDSRFISWGAGDTFLVYPGARSSIRFERLIAGIQAYEKIRILKAEFLKGKEQSKLNKLDSILKRFDEQELKNKPAAFFVSESNKDLNEF